nr:A/G-specific adenine glycosylase [Acuticoccus sediminis]
MKVPLDIMKKKARAGGPADRRAARRLAARKPKNRKSAKAAKSGPAPGRPDTGEALRPPAAAGALPVAPARGHAPEPAPAVDAEPAVEAAPKRRVTRSRKAPAAPEASEIAEVPAAETAVPKRRRARTAGAGEEPAPEPAKPGRTRRAAAAQRSVVSSLFAATDDGDGPEHGAAAPAAGSGRPALRALPAPDRAAGRALLAWYDRHRRSLPWRAEPGETADPYRVWLSEIMLQQTTVAAVKSYYETFLTRWPTIADLAAADDGDVMAAWAGLGYYARARNLVACARVVAATGFPVSREGLAGLPGVGDYTSAAIAAIAFGEPAPVVDGNVERVVARLTRLARPPKTVRREVEAIVAAMLPADRPGDFAQAMMDLGATICTPKSPACGICPLREGCAASAAGDMLDYPVKAPRRARSVWHGVAFVAVRPDGAILLRRRPARGLLGGMAEVFGSAWGGPVAVPLEHAPFDGGWAGVGSITHGFTHAELTVDVYSAAVPADAPTPAGAWWALPDDAGLPTVMKKVVVRALAMAG